MAKAYIAEQERKLGVLVYGFPPNVGATGTAALLNVPKSLEKLLAGLKDQGYDLGPGGAAIDGEAIISALKMQEDQRAILEGSAGILKRCAGMLSLTGADPAASRPCVAHWPCGGCGVGGELLQVCWVFGCKAAGRPPCA